MVNVRSYACVRNSPMLPPSLGQQLTTWAEIADYLGVSIRQAQIHEELHGLPVHRMPGQRRRVVAYSAEIDAWREQLLERRPAGEAESPPPSPLKPRPRWRLPAAVAGAIVIALGAAGGYWFAHRGGPPATWKTQGRTLSVSDAQGRLVWSYDFGEEVDEVSERSAQTAGHFADVTGDGVPEFLFAKHTRHSTDQPGAGELICFSPSGTPLWTYRCERTVTSGKGLALKPPYALTFAIAPHGRIVVLSLHHWSYPTQVSVLQARDGRLTGEYWHHGHLKTIAFTDVDDDGRIELLVGGVDDGPGRKLAQLIAFDLDRVAGSSHSPGGELHFPALGRGTEKISWWFALSAASAGEEFNQVVSIPSEAPLAVVVAEGTAWPGPPALLYEFSHHLRPASVRFLDAEVGALGQRLFEQPHALEAELSRLQAAVTVERY
jgi:hypothetical protein